MLWVFFPMMLNSANMSSNAIFNFLCSRACFSIHLEKCYLPVFNLSNMTVNHCVLDISARFVTTSNSNASWQSLYQSGTIDCMYPVDWCIHKIHYPQFETKLTKCIEYLQQYRSVSVVYVTDAKGNTNQHHLSFSVFSIVSSNSTTNAFSQNPKKMQ